MIFFAPNCTLPPGESSGFVTSPNTRSTLEIVWGCISIILLSTWSILHLDLPAHLTPKKCPKSFWKRFCEDFCKRVYLLCRKVFWMGLKLFSSEFAATGCARKIFATRSNSTRLQQWAHHDGVPWSLTHTILVDMGGIALRFKNDNLEWAPTEDEKHAFIHEFCEKQNRILAWCGKTPWSLLKTHVDYATQKAEEINKENKVDFANISKDVAALAGDIWILDSNQLAIAREMKVIKKLPHIGEDEITDKSKAGPPVKFLAMLQILWLVVQLIVRAIYRLPFTQLEITTVAFAASAIIIYSIDFDKPKDINVPFYFDVDVDELEKGDYYEAFSAIVDAAPFAYVQSKRYYMPTSTLHDLIVYKHNDEVKVKGKPRKEGSDCWCRSCKRCRWSAFDGNKLHRAFYCVKCRKPIMSKGMADCFSLLIGFVSATSFGGVHLFSWNSHFPTEIERLLWKIAAIMTIVLPYIYICTHLFFFNVPIKEITKETRWKMRMGLLAIAICYVPCRLFLIAESFRALYYMEPMAFRSTWTQNIPHVG